MKLPTIMCADACTYRHPQDVANACRTAKSFSAAAGPLAVVLRGVEHSDSRVRIKAIAASARMVQLRWEMARERSVISEHAVSIIALRLEDPDGEVRCASVTALGLLGGRIAAAHAGAVAALLEDDDWGVRDAAMQALIRLGKQAVAHAAMRLEHEEANVRAAALMVLRGLREHAGAHAAAIAARLEDDDHTVQWKAALALAELGTLGELGALSDAVPKWWELQMLNSGGDLDSVFPEGDEGW